VAKPIEAVLNVADLPEKSTECPKWRFVAAGRDHSLAVSDAG